MLHADARFSEAVERAVAALEQRTDAEVVVVAAARSGDYRDVAFLAATVGSFALLLAMLFLPIVVSPVAVAIEMAIAWPLLAWFGSGPVVARRLSSKERQRRQVRDAAAAEFHREAVHGTPRRTGLLVYVSALEGEVLLLPDVGIEALVPPGEWGPVRRAFAHDDLDHFLAGLKEVGEVLARHVPPVEGRSFALADAPRVRP